MPHYSSFFQGFHEGRFQVLVAIDVAARGLDIPEVDLVIQCEPPKVHVCKKEAVCVYVSYECVVRVCIMYVYARKERERQYGSSSLTRIIHVCSGLSMLVFSRNYILYCITGNFHEEKILPIS